MNVQSLILAAAVGGMFAITSPASAQSADSTAASAAKSRWELLLPSGAMIPTGVQRDAVKRGNLSALQLTFASRSGLAVASTLGWTRSRDVASAGEPKLDVFTYDAGLEWRAPRWASGTVGFRPFAGVGAGGRSYNYRKLDLDATHNLAGYASAGGDLTVRRVRVRLEARDYVGGFKPLDGNGEGRRSNDVVVMVGLGIVPR